MKKILFMLSVIVFGISPAVSAVSDWQLTKYYAPSTDGGNYLRDVYMTPEGKFVDKMGSAIKEADLIDPDFTKNLTPKLEPSIPNSTPSATPSANTAATNTHWGVNRETGAMEKLTKKGNRFYDQAGNQISAKGENIKTYKLEELDKANKYAEKIAKERMSGGTAGGGTGGIAQKIGYEGVGKLNVGQAVGGAIELAAGSVMLGNSITKEGRVDAKDVAVGALGGGLATHGAVNMLRSSGIPIDPVTTSIAVAAGATLGAAATATRIATQGDCFDDAVHGEYACCNTVAGNTVLSGGVLYDIGDATHCTGSDGKPKFGYITYCMQGSYKTDQGLKGKFLDDHWSDCEGGQWCPGYMEPENSDMKINTIAFWKHRPGGGHTLPCWKWECSDEGYIRQGNKCIPDPNAKVKSEDEQPGDKEPDGTNPSETKKTCNDLYAGHPKRLACCKAGKTTKWTGDIDNGSCYCVVPETQQPDNSKSWNGAKCIAKSDIGGDCKYRFTKTVTCSKGTQMVIDTEILLDKEDLNGRNCAEFNKQFAGNSDMEQKLAEKYCPDNIKEEADDSTKQKEQEEAEKQRKKIEQLTKSKANLDAFFSKVNSDKSVWKNADGSFNGVRLASDLTAGVVLGTVGGVVSGVLIKKSQVEKGFDALNCTINGQKVADWGDEFSVGLRR